VQNVAIQVGYQHTSALLFNLLNQTKIIFTAVMVYLFIGTRPMPQQVLALGLVLLAGVVLSLPPSHGDSAVDPMIFDFWFGVVPTLAASLLSGIATAWTQRVLTIGAQRNAYLYTLELSTYSSILLMSSLLWSNSGSISTVMTLFRRTFEASPLCWIPVLSNACGGLVAGQVIKHVGGVRRSFAVISGIMLTGILEWLVLGASISPRVWVCIPVVVGSIYLYATASASTQSKPKLQ